MNQRNAEKLKFELLETWNTFNHYVTEALTFQNSEDIHRARVHLRKLITFMQVYETKPATFRQLKQLMEALGHVRDSDVLIESFDVSDDLDQAFLEEMERQRAANRTVLTTRVGEKMTPSLDQQLRRFIGGQLFRAFKKQDASSFLDKAKAERKERIRASKNTTDSDTLLETLHKVRLAVKRERYLHEYLLNYESDASIEVVRKLKQIQTTLGEMNDTHQLLLQWEAFTPPSYLKEAYAKRVTTLRSTLEESIHHVSL
ncbi:CHAD domain-containing protein [Exiguobacterium algae]|uniref:CHAD domain-containing protein n=1 Tax=Exiguobacterium algae TaxID=2751250 RepID=UPI001BEBDFB8|nr:CHAD domain-containing protein [Exiguobacterium algae]